jgi:DNA repair exonuclease SbcCD ATPase subunit
LKDSSQRVHKVNPYREWNELLEPVGLTFTLGSYSGENINRFINSDQVTRRNTNFEINENDFDTITPMVLNSINFGSTYRQHCWPSNQTINFTQVNLLEGSNGSGKTSVLEAIELAFTGEVLRNKMSDAAEDEMWDGKLSFFEGTVKEIEGLPNPSVQRERERKYYQYQARERVRTRLLNLFYHRYNYFTSEDIFRHCYRNEKPDFRNEFARIIFGDELTLYEQNLTRYKNEFIALSRNYLNDIKSKKIEILNIRTEIDEANSVISSRIKATLPLIKNLIQDVWRTYPLYEEKSSRRELQHWFEVLYSHVSEVEGISRPLKNAVESGFGNITQLNEQSKKVEYSRVQFVNTQTDLQKNEKELPEVSDLQTKLVEIQVKITRIERREIELNKNLKYLHANRLLLINESGRSRRKIIEQNILTSEKKLLHLEQLQQQWAHIVDSVFEFQDEVVANERLLLLKAKQKNIETELKQVMTQIQTVEQKYDSLRKITTQIKSLGKVYSNEHPEQSVCPLCSHDHGTAAALQAIINQDMMQDQQHLSVLRQKECTLKNQVEDTASEVEKIKVQIDNLKEVQLAYLNLKEHEELLNFEINTKDKLLPIEIIGLFKFLIEQINGMQKELADWKHEVKFLEINRFTLENIRQLEDILNKESMNDLFSELSSAESFIHTMEMNLNKIKEEKVSLNGQIENEKLHISSVKKKLEEMQYKKDLIKKEIVTNQQQKNLIDQIYAVLARLKEKTIYLNNEMLFSQFHESVVKLNEEIKGILAVFQNNESVVKKQEKVTTLEGELNDVIKKNTNCVQALDVMNQLQPLGNYIQEFMTLNISMINDIFLRLHTPQDFEKLELGEAEELIAFRKLNDKREPFTINQMSTGQRTALILAIFFVMHMSMESAPNILLLDEPVANMDDLNVLALIDFLRQFTLTRNTQIFFTTANPNVSSLFRRKFSILKERFKTFHIHRMDGEHARIEIKTFLPEKEEGIPVHLTN